ncbi:MAG TPA: histidine kinase, partial [Steroidobacteraceae bacterium]|nr:histidine kinase [Steroidobacteraceae bacterium]
MAYLGWGAAAFLLPAYSALRRKYARLEAQLTSSELRRLRAQLDPHFLFNALNAISELGYTDPEA